MLFRTVLEAKNQIPNGRLTLVSWKASLLAIVFFMSVILMGCGNAKDENLKLEEDVVTTLQKSFQLPVPDGSYSTLDGNAGVSVGAFTSNVKAMIFLVDQVGSGLKEVNLKLAQTISGGTRENGALKIINSTLGTELIGSKKESEGVIYWAYHMNGVTIFTGKTSISGTTGEFTVLANAAIGTQQTLLQWVFSNVNGKAVKDLMVLNNKGNLHYSIGDETKLSGSSNAQDFSAEWSKTKAGFYKLSSGSLKFCWDFTLSNQACVD